MLRLAVLVLSASVVLATSESVSEQNKANDAVEGRSLRTSIQADPNYPGVYPGGVYPGGGFPGGVYPGYNRPSNCREWCRRQNYNGYPGAGRVTYFCCDRSGPIVYPQPYPGPYPVGPGPFPVGPGPLPVGPGPFPVGPGPFPVGPGPFPGPFTQTGTNHRLTVGPPAPPSVDYGRYRGAYRVCPRPAPVCLTARNFASPPTQCYGDSECASTDKCCHDTCLQHRVCKTADYVSTRPLLNRFNNRYATRGGRQYDDATTTSQSFSDLVRHADSDIQADDDGPVVTSSGRVTSDDPAGSSSGSQSSSGSFKFE